MRTVMHSIITVCICGFLMTGTNAGLIPIENFTDMSDADFIDLPASNFLSTVTFGALTISHSPDVVNGAFGTWPIGTAENPGNGEGYTATEVFGISPSMTLDFNLPLSSFGVSFFHFDPNILDNDLANPAHLLVFDGSNGTGNLLGDIYSSGFIPGSGAAHQDFVGLISDQTNIRSAILTGTGIKNGFGVDGYGISFMSSSVPEPTLFYLMALSLIFFGLINIFRKRKLNS